MPAKWLRSCGSVSGEQVIGAVLVQSVTISSAIAPVAAEIMPGRPPVKAMTTAMQKDA